MAEHTRDGKIVIDLTMGPRSDWLTTRENFVKDDFLAVKNGIQKLESTRDGATALQHLKAGDTLNEAEKALLKKNLGNFAENGAAVKAVQQWVKDNGNKLPEALWHSEGQAVFQDDIRAGAKRLAGVKNAETAVATMKDIEAGKAVTDAARTEALKTFKEAGLQNGRNELSLVGSALMKEEGKAFLTGAGLKAATSTARTVEEIAQTTATSSSFVKGAGKAAIKKLPVLGTALGVIAMAASMQNAASAAELPKTEQPPASPEEQHRREQEQMVAEMKRNGSIAKEFVLGVVGLAPVPFADVALRAYMDRDEERMKAQYDQAMNPNRRETIDYDKLIFTPEARGGLRDDFNAVAPPGTPSFKITMDQDATQQRPVAKAGAAPKSQT
ncbi:MAG: hypothetical protein ACAH83_08775 [Alphaproteobacteria bacterium]